MSNDVVHAIREDVTLDRLVYPSNVILFLMHLLKDALGPHGSIP